MKVPRLLLTFDSIAALAAGTVTLSALPLLSPLYGWTPEFTRYVALVNLAYGCYSGTLALLLRTKGILPRWTVALLVAANGLWALQCFFQAWRLRDTASALGLCLLVFEGLFVGGLAYVEARLVLPVAERRTQGSLPASVQGSTVENGKPKEYP